MTGPSVQASRAIEPTARLQKHRMSDQPWWQDPWPGSGAIVVQGQPSRPARSGECPQAEQPTTLVSRWLHDQVGVPSSADLGFTRIFLSSQRSFSPVGARMAWEDQTLVTPQHVCPILFPLCLLLLGEALTVMGRCSGAPGLGGGSQGKGGSPVCGPRDAGRPFQAASGLCPCFVGGTPQPCPSAPPQVGIPRHRFQSPQALAKDDLTESCDFSIPLWGNRGRLQQAVDEITPSGGGLHCCALQRGGQTGGYFSAERLQSCLRVTPFLLCPREGRLCGGRVS